MLDKVNDDHAPVLITRQNGKPAVLISLDDFSSYEETAYLLGSATNARRLAESLEQVVLGSFTERDLLDDDDSVDWQCMGGLPALATIW